jgi:hypothetical protein
MVTPIGLGLLAIVAGIAILFVPGVGIIGVLLIVIGALLAIGSFASSRRRPGAPPSRT